jgi:hypothetical protein
MELRGAREAGQHEACQRVLLHMLLCCVCCTCTMGCMQHIGLLVLVGPACMFWGCMRVQRSFHKQDRPFCSEHSLAESAAKFSCVCLHVCWLLPCGVFLQCCWPAT